MMRMMTTAVRKPRPGIRRPKNLRVHRGEEIVDRVPEDAQEPGRGDRGNGDEEQSGDEPDLHPVAKTTRHVQSMRSRAPRQVKELTGKVALVTGGAVRVGRAIALRARRRGRGRGGRLPPLGRRSARHGRASSRLAACARSRCAPTWRGRARRARSWRARSGASGGSTSWSTTPRVFFRTPAADHDPRAVRPAPRGRICAAPFFVSQAAARAMGQRGGRIVNIADVGAVRAWAGYMPYGISKAGVIMLTRGLAVALAPRIQVNAVAPGVVLLPGRLPARIGRRRRRAHPDGPPRTAGRRRGGGPLLRHLLRLRHRAGALRGRRHVDRLVGGGLDGPPSLPHNGLRRRSRRSNRHCSSRLRTF